MKKKCLIIDDMHPTIVPMIEAIGLEPDYRPDITKEEVYEIIAGYEGIIVRSKLFVDDAFLKKALKLEFIGRAGAGVDNVDMDVLGKTNIKLLNAPEGNRDAVAEHTLGMILSMVNKFRKADSEVRNYLWDREGNRGFEIKGKTFAIIGYGFMGKAVAKRLSGFGCNVIAYDKYKKNYADENAKEADMNEIYESADFLSIHVPLTDETRFMVDETYLSKFKKSIWFVSTARGEIVKLKGLIQNIESGKVLGAALDVLENEKINKLSPEQKVDFEYLIHSDKVLLTPHVAGWSYESYERINQVLVEKIKAIL